MGEQMGVTKTNDTKNNKRIRFIFLIEIDLFLVYNRANGPFCHKIRFYGRMGDVFFLFLSLSLIQVFVTALVDIIIGWWQSTLENINSMRLPALFMRANWVGTKKRSKRYKSSFLCCLWPGAAGGGVGEVSSHVVMFYFPEIPIAPLFRCWSSSEMNENLCQNGLCAHIHHLQCKI